jgi:hypothetical protein
METTYVENDDNDIIITLHGPGTKEIDQLMIYRYLPFPMPIPILPKDHNLRIAQSLSNKFFAQSTLDQIFNQNDVNHPEEPEAMFVSVNFNFIKVSANVKFQILSQVEMASYVKRNHVYLCEIHKMVKSDSTDTCLGALYLRMEKEVHKHCKFKRKYLQTFLALENKLTLLELINNL